MSRHLVTAHEPDQGDPAPVAALPASIVFVGRERGTDRVRVMPGRQA